MVRLTVGEILGACPTVREELRDAISQIVAEIINKVPDSELDTINLCEFGSGVGDLIIRQIRKSRECHHVRPGYTALVPIDSLDV